MKPTKLEKAIEKIQILNYLDFLQRNGSFNMGASPSLITANFPVSWDETLAIFCEWICSFNDRKDSR